MRINKTDFLKSESYGKYIYFQGRVSTTSGQTDINDSENLKNGSNHNTALTAAAIATGITIGILGGSFFIFTPNETGATTNTSIKGVVINTEAEELKFVTDMYLYRITKEFPDMLKAYRKTKRKIADKKM